MEVADPELAGQLRRGSFWSKKYLFHLVDETGVTLPVRRHLNYDIAKGRHFVSYTIFQVIDCDLHCHSDLAGELDDIPTLSVNHPE